MPDSRIPTNHSYRGYDRNSCWKLDGTSLLEPMFSLYKRWVLILRNKRTDGGAEASEVNHYLDSVPYLNGAWTLLHVCLCSL